mmetsp:Transcript_50565/g.110668  ORF Transcript_50565/g.110668 Transcript_50565/m.110668 type:complete len:209 (-) Transcript_50565:183-809(-)
MTVVLEVGTWSCVVVVDLPAVVVLVLVVPWESSVSSSSSFSSFAASSSSSSVSSSSLAPFPSFSALSPLASVSSLLSLSSVLSWPPPPGEVPVVDAKSPSILVVVTQTAGPSPALGFPSFGAPNQLTLSSRTGETGATASAALNVRPLGFAVLPTLSVSPPSSATPSSSTPCISTTPRRAKAARAIVLSIGPAAPRNCSMLTASPCSG